MSNYELIFKALADPKRLRLLLLLLKEEQEFFVCELADALSEYHYNVSKYLRELKRAGLVEEERRGKGVCYQIKPAQDEFTNKLYQALKAIDDAELEAFQKRLRLRRSLRGENECVMRNDSRWGKMVAKLDKLTLNGGR